MRMDTSFNLALPYLAAGQAQKHVTMNDALDRLDQLVQLTAQASGVVTPPASPPDGTRYLLGAVPTGIWTGKGQQIAVFEGGAWSFIEPKAGWRAWVLDAQSLHVFRNGSWQPVTAIPDQLPLLGLNATASTTNRLSVASDAALFSHAGTNHRLIVNKAGTAQTASLLFQSNYSGRAEIGLTGTNALSMRVSADGTNWTDALRILPETGQVVVGASNGNSELLQVSADIGGQTIRAYSQIGGISWMGDIDGAKWSSKLGGYFLSFMSDNGNTANLEAAPVAFAGRDWRVKARLSGSGQLQLTDTLACPAIPTTASGANATIDAADAFRLKRSTSSIRYKTDIENLESTRAEAVVMKARPVWYRSKAQSDNPNWGWYGLIAEEIAALDPRLVSWRYDDTQFEDVPSPSGAAGETKPSQARRLRAGARPVPDGVQYDRLTVLLLDVVRRQAEKLKEIEDKLRFIVDSRASNARIL
jgi:hypothetical protein